MNMTVTSANTPRGPGIATIAAAVLAIAALAVGIAALVSVQNVRKAADEARAGVTAVRDEIGKAAIDLSNHVQHNDRVFRAVADELQVQKNDLGKIVAQLTPRPAPAPAAGAAGGAAAGARGGALPPAGAAPAAGTQGAAGGAPAAPAAPSGKTHKIESGDSFGKIAKKYGTTSAALEKANPGVNSSKLKIGQTINLP